MTQNNHQFLKMIREKIKGKNNNPIIINKNNRISIRSPPSKRKTKKFLKHQFTTVNNNNSNLPSLRPFSPNGIVL